MKHQVIGLERFQRVQRETYPDVAMMRAMNLALELCDDQRLGIREQES